MQLRLCAKCVKLTQIMDHLGSSQSHGNEPNRLGCLEEVKFGIVQRFQEVAGEGKLQRRAVAKRRATPLPS